MKKTRSRKSRVIVPLKGPKHEILNGLDFHNFFTIKSLYVGDFGTCLKNSKFLCLVYNIILLMALILFKSTRLVR